MYFYMSCPSFLGSQKQICVGWSVPDGSTAIEVNWLTIARFLKEENKTRNSVKNTENQHTIDALA